MENKEGKTVKEFPTKENTGLEYGVEYLAKVQKWLNAYDTGRIIAKKKKLSIEIIGNSAYDLSKVKITKK
jgi:hypothetical protein